MFYEIHNYGHHMMGGVSMFLGFIVWVLIIVLAIIIIGKVLSDSNHQSHSTNSYERDANVIKELEESIQEYKRKNIDLKLENEILLAKLKKAEGITE